MSVLLIGRNYVLFEGIIKIVCVCVFVSDESMQKCFGEGSGLVYRDVLSWLQSPNTQLQLSGALAIANFARNGEIFVRKEHRLYGDMYLYGADVG